MSNSTRWGVKVTITSRELESLATRLYRADRSIDAAMAERAASSLRWLVGEASALQAEVEQLRAKLKAKEAQHGEFLVMLEAGVYLASGDGDPPRTLKSATAQRFATFGQARTALAGARHFRPFEGGRVVSTTPPDQCQPAAVFCYARPRPGWTCIENWPGAGGMWCSMCVARWNHNVFGAEDVPAGHARLAELDDAQGELARLRAFAKSQQCKRWCKSVGGTLADRPPAARSEYCPRCLAIGEVG